MFDAGLLFFAAGTHIWRLFEFFAVDGDVAFAYLSAIVIMTFLAQNKTPMNFRTTHSISSAVKIVCTSVCAVGISPCSKQTIFFHFP